MQNNKNNKKSDFQYIPLRQVNEHSQILGGVEVCEDKQVLNTSQTAKSATVIQWGFIKGFFFSFRTKWDLSMQLYCMMKVAKIKSKFCNLFCVQQ